METTIELGCDESKAIVAERRRFAQELHDVVGSRLQTAMLYLDEALGALEPDELAAESIRSAKNHLHECWEEARRAARALRPAALDRGLVAAMSDYVLELQSAGQAGVRLNTTGTPRKIPSQKEHALLRIGQEAVTNALRHASPKNVSVEIAFDADAVRLDITDNGEGFDRQAGLCSSGLLNMKDRAHEIGADLSIYSVPGHGTEVLVALPLTGTSAEFESTIV